MHKLFIIIIISVLSLTANCRSFPPVEPVDQKSAVLAAGIDLLPVIQVFSSDRVEVDYILFARVKPGKSHKDAEEIILSTWVQDDNRAYLFNAEPGEYVAIGALESRYIPSQNSTSTSGNTRITVTFKGGDIVYVTYFPDSIVKSSRTRVEPGKLNYMGNIKVQMMHVTGEIKKSDATQKIYHQKGLDQGLYEKGFFITGGKESFQNDETSRTEFMQAAREDFGNKSGWKSYIKP